MKILLIFSIFLGIFCVEGSSNGWCSRQSLEEAFETAFELKVGGGVSRRSQTRIVNGNPAVRGQFGFFVFLESFDGRWQTPCGGALIRYNWVLTAGQCIVCARSVTAIFGQVDRNGGPLSWLTHISDPDHIKYHQNYNPWDFSNNPFLNDIGLVYLADAREPILLPFVTSIDLTDDLENDFYRTQATTMGFGSTQDPADRLSLQLNYVEMSVISNGQCNETFTNVIDDTKLCTDTSNGGPCQGDAGGPLIARNEEFQWVVIGVTSFRHRDGCGLGHPAVFTRITSFINWITSIVDVKIQAPAPPLPEPDTNICHCYCHACSKPEL